MKREQRFIALVVLVVPLLLSCATKKADQRPAEHQLTGLRTGHDLIEGR